MGEAFLMRQGGNRNVMTADYALICVQYPAGSACVCEKGQKRLAARDTSGGAAFAVPEAGSWTVTISQGADSKTAAVTISSRGQIEYRVMTYSDILFAPGAGTEQLWDTDGNAEANGTGIVIRGTVDYGGTPLTAWAYLREPVSLAGKSTLTIDAALATLREQPISSVPTNIYVISEDYQPTSTQNAALSQTVTDGSHTGQDAYVLDVSGLDGTKRYYVTFQTTAINWSDGGTYYRGTSELTVTGVVAA